MATVTRRAIRRAFPRLTLVALAWCTLTGGVFSGCPGLFTPAVPERPVGPPIILDYREPEATLRTMAQGLQAKDQGAAAWVGAFADSTDPDDVGFHHIFDPDDVRVCDCTAPTTWRISQEQLFYLEFLKLSLSANYVAEFDSVRDNPDPQPGDTQAILYRSYRVLASEEDGNTSVIAIGYADLTFTKHPTNSRWLITRWVDHVDPAVGANPINPEQLTLGRRRLEYAQ